MRPLAVFQSGLILRSYVMMYPMSEILTERVGELAFLFLI
jgi:hypothetical protein